MIRYVVAVAAAVDIVLALGASPLKAQTTTFTVTTTAANVHAGPSTGSTVLGVVARGKTIEVSRDLGSWVAVAWPAAPSGVGYLHVSWLSVARPNASAPAAAAPDKTPAEPTPQPTTGDTSSPSMPPPAPPPAAIAPQAEAQPAQSLGLSVDRRAEIAGSRSAQTSPRAPRTPGTFATTAIPSRFVGIGGRMPMPAKGFAASGRVWMTDAIGVQLEGGRTTYAAADTFGPRMRTMAMGVSAVYSTRPAVGDAVLVRPYFGGGVSVLRTTLVFASGIAGPADRGVGYQLLGGGEFMWASAPHLAVSADLRREWRPAPLPGFNPSTFALGLSAHWYVK